MLQKYNISINAQDNLLSIKEYAVLGNISKQRSEFQNPESYDYIMTYQIHYQVESISKAIKEGKEALISTIRSEDFFPIRPCAEIIADKITEIMNQDTSQLAELFFDDRALLPTHEAVH